MRFAIATILCLAAAPLQADITAPLGSQERSEQIMQEARDTAKSILVDAGITDPFDLVARREQVLEKRFDACIALHYRDPDAAILTQVCFDLFMELGFPD